MVKSKKTNTNKKGYIPLDQLSFSFEYDKTYRDIIKENNARARQ